MNVIGILGAIAAIATALFALTALFACVVLSARISREEERREAERWEELKAKIKPEERTGDR